MKIKIKKNTLIDHLKFIEKIIDPLSINTIYKNLLIRVEKTCIKFLASNGIISSQEIIEISDDLKIEESGETLLDAKSFLNVVKYHDELILIYIKKQSIYLESKNYKSKLNLIVGQEYPFIDFDLKGQTILLDNKLFNNAIKNISNIANEIKGKVIFKGLNIKAKNNKLFFLATDTFRVGKNIVEVNEKKLDFNITIFAKELKKIISSNFPLNSKVEITFNENAILLKHLKTFIVCRTIDDVYPDVEQVFPQNFEKELIIDKNILSYAIEKTLAFAKDVFENPVIMNLDANKLTLVTENEEYGTLESNIDKINWNYEKFQIKFNANYLKEALKSFEGLIKIGFNNNDQPFVVSNLNNKELEYLILPYRILE